MIVLPGTPAWLQLTDKYSEILGVRPNSAQVVSFNDPARVKLVMGGERSGKSLMGALYLSLNHLQAGEKALFWLVGRDYELCRPEFGYLAEHMVQLYGANGIDLSFPKEGPCAIKVKATGTRIETRTAEDPKRIAGLAPNGILGCEVALWDYETFLRVNGRSAEKRAWIWLSGSFESSLGWVPELFQKWSVPNSEDSRSFALPSWTNTAIFPGGEGDPEILRLKGLYPADRFQERFAGRPVPPSGRVFPEFQAISHISLEAEYQPHKPVYLAVDPGDASAYSVLFIQEDSGQVLVFDEIYAQRLTHDEVIHLAQIKPCWKDVDSGVIDFAARQHHATRAPVEVWYERAHIHLSSQYILEEDGRDRLHTFLRTNPLTNQPNLLVHPRCRGLISEMGCGPSPIAGGGIYKFKTDSGGNTTSDKPVDAYNHSIKALSYFLVDRFGFVARASYKSANYLYRDEETKWRP